MEEVTAVFDIGKTNKKLFLFNNNGNVVYESTEALPETTDDDGFLCEDIRLLKNWILDKWRGVVSKNVYNISCVNFTSYGASLVHLDKYHEPATPLYSYLKPYPAELAEELYEHYKGKWNFSVTTGSPPMGMLNSGLQLIWLKHRKPELFVKITSSLHLPQYLSFLFSKEKVSEYTSIGCHTSLWDFSAGKYHQWVNDEGVYKLLAPIIFTPIAAKTQLNTKEISVGAGLHDSSSALIPYLEEKQSFLLISTGTWCINLNPFNCNPLTKEELSLDCLCYMTPAGRQVKASRIFLGREHEFQAARIERHFQKANGYCNTIKFDYERLSILLTGNNGEEKLIPACMENTGPFSEKPSKEWNLNRFSSCEDAYLQLMADLTCMLKYSMQLVDSLETKIIFVEGGFGDNELFMYLLAGHFPRKKVRTSLLKQATALGALMQVNPSFKPAKWEFRDYHPSGISSQLESYYDRFWKKNQSR